MNKPKTMLTFNFTDDVKASVSGMTLEEFQASEKEIKTKQYDVNKDLETARSMIAEIEKKCITRGFMGVELDGIFDNLKRYDSEFTIIHSVIENVFDELCCITEAIRYWERGSDYWGLTKVQAKSHAKKLIRFIENNLHLLSKSDQMDYIAQLKKYNV